MKTNLIYILGMMCLSGTVSAQTTVNYTEFLFELRINKYDMDFGGMAVHMEHDSYSAEVGVVQPIYAGGSIYHTYKASQIQSQIADKSVDLTTDNLIYAAVPQ